MADALLREGSDGALLRATALTRRFGGLTAVNNVSLDLQIGEVHAVIGTNGAGKSTLINMLSGELPASSGSTLLNGHDIGAWPQPKRARAGIGRSYQRTTIFPSFSVLENCRLSAQAAAAARLGRLAIGADAARTATQAARARARRRPAWPITRMRPAGLLSHGGQRQLEIAMCLATQPARAVARRTARRHGRRGDRAHARVAGRPETRAMRCCWSNTTWMRSSASPTGSP